jgi:hypothetical protein
MKWIIRLALLLAVLSIAKADIVYTEPTNLPPVAAEGLLVNTNGVIVSHPNFKGTNDLASAATLSNLTDLVTALQAAFAGYTNMASTALVFRFEFDLTNAALDSRIQVVETNRIPLARLPVTNDWTNSTMILQSPDGTNLYWVQP